MNRINKKAMQVAVLIQEQLSGGKHQELPIYLPEHAWNNIVQLRRRIDLAHQHGWHRAASRLARDLAYAIDDYRCQLESIGRNLQSCQTERQVASASNVYKDILALYDEFEEVDIDLDEHKLSVTTDCIVLEDVHLGNFEIRLDWGDLGRHQPYRVVALDPHPAARREDVTHPHVQEGSLCEGEGSLAIRAALAECRLHDFFLLVSQLLHTYGRGSAYVELDNWFGVPCDDCGDSLDEDERYYCHRCEATLCGNCSVSCQGCDDSYCSGCISTCAACDSDYCTACLDTCPVCKKRFCENCLEEGGLCRSCHEEKRNEEEKKDDPPQKKTRKRPVGSSPARPRRRTAAASV